MKFDFQNSTMSPVLPFDIIALIIDIVGEKEDTDLLKELALVSHSFLQICNKHLFSTVELHDADPIFHVASSKKGFVKLLKSRPEVVKYTRKLTYETKDKYWHPTPNFHSEDDLLSPLLPNFLQTISLLNYLKINASNFSMNSTSDWNKLNPSLTSAFLHLMHLPTINHIDLSFISNFPLPNLTSSVVNLQRLDILCLTCFEYSEQDGEDGSSEIVQSEMPPKIREFNTSDSTLLTTKLLHAKMQDGRPAYNFTDLRRLSMSFARLEDEQNIRFLLQDAELLEKLHLSVGCDWSLERLHDILSTSARTLKILGFTVPLYSLGTVRLPLGGLCEVLESIAGQNILEDLSFEVAIFGLETVDYIGLIIQKVEDILVKPGWSALKYVSFKVSCECLAALDLSEALQSLPDKYLSQLSKRESITFNYSADVWTY